MKQRYLQLLKFLSQRDSQDFGAVQWTFEDLAEEDVEYLMEKNYIRVSLGENYSGRMKFLHLTPEGQDFIKTYCEVCECMPCDCGYGN